MTLSCRIADFQSRRSMLLTLTLLLPSCVMPLSAQTFVSFDAPGAGTGLQQGTFSTCINQDGTVAGYYFDSTSVTHSFARSNTGAITEFDPPGLTNDVAAAINRSGQIVGYGSNAAAQRTDGFLRNASGFGDYDCDRNQRQRGNCGIFQ
jgi:hypothetical protein